MKESQEEKSVALLRVIASLLVRNDRDRVRSLKEQIEILSDLGLMPADIALIVGRTGKHVNKELVGIRKDKKKRR
jgi:hypothetical protein